MLNKNADKEKISCIVKKIRKYRVKKINPILENKEYTEEEKKEKLVDQLRTVRFSYNIWDSFSSKFVLSFLLGLIGLLVGQAKNISVDGNVNILKIFGIDFCSVSNRIGDVEPNKAILLFIGGFFLVILLCQGLFVYVANIYYEEMEVVKAELEKINNLAQSNPEKISIRIYNRNLVRRSFFGR